jgi:hypothetical protein
VKHGADDATQGFREVLIFGANHGNNPMPVGGGAGPGGVEAVGLILAAAEIVTSETLGLCDLHSG